MPNRISPAGAGAPATRLIPLWTPPATLNAMQKVFLTAGSLNYQRLLAASDYVDTAFSAKTPLR
jgi:hypothetical protein